MTPAYRKMVEAWHQPVGTPAPTDEHGRPQLVLEILNTGERLTAPAHRDDGCFRAYDLDRLAHALRDTRTQDEFPIDPAVADLVYQVQTHFKAGAIRVVSAYRTRKATGQSNHGRGRALDIVVPGAKDEDVAAFVRSRGFVGVGTYPTSGFLHIDVRPQSYYWIDQSGPGQPNRERGTQASVAATNDAVAAASGRRPPSPWAEPSGDVAAIWGGGAATPEADDDDPEDDLEEEP